MPKTTAVAIACCCLGLILGAHVRARAADEHLQIGAPTAIENLSVFPVHGAADTAPVAFTTLDAALARGDAVVKERDADGQVDQLSIMNRGKQPIYVLAGTLVQGGKQDRQIGQDVVLDPGKTLAVDAYCVEQGRWTTQRSGQATHGRFAQTKGLAVREVRRAAQYKRDQREVWSKVSEVNAVHKKSPASSTLLATVDAADVTRERQRLTQAIDAALRSAETTAPVIGLAYAVDGQVRNVRWFQSAGVFQLFRTTLVEAAALDALTAQASGSAKQAPSVAPQAVEQLVDEVERGPSHSRDTAGQNRNEYREANKGYGAKTRLKSLPPTAAPISSDYMAK